MVSKQQRARQLARARGERQAARRVAQRHRRRRRAVVAGVVVAIVAVVAGGVLASRAAADDRTGPSSRGTITGATVAGGVDQS